MIDVDFDPQIASAMSRLQNASKEEQKAVVRHLAEFAPAEMRQLMDTATRTGKTGYRKGGGKFTRSARGEVPAMDSFDLYHSITARAEGMDVIITFAEEAKYLDPVFEGMGNAGGYLRRPFIERGLDEAVKRLSAI